MGKAITMPTSAGTGAGARGGSPEFFMRGWDGRRTHSRHRSGPAAAGCGSKELPPDHLQGIAKPAVDAKRGGGLESRVHQAILAPGVVAVTILLPLGLVQEVVEAGVVDVGDEVA